MLKRIRYGYFKGINLKLFYCTVPAEPKTQEKQEVVEFKRKFIRPFSKDMLLNRFNLDLFTYPEVYTSREVDIVNKLSEKLHSLLKLSMEQKDKNDQSKIMDLLSQSGILGLCVPEKYLGSNYDFMMYGRILEVLSGDMGFVLNVLNPQFLATQALLYAGSEEQRDKYLPGLVSGEIRGTVAIQESSANDIVLHNVHTTAYLDERERVYIINGKSEKLLGCGGAQFIIAYARTSERMVSAFVVPLDADGVRSTLSDSNELLEASAHDIWFDNVRVPVDNLLTNMSAFELSRKMASINNMSVATSCSGLVKKLLETTNEFVSSRNIFGKPLSQSELIQYYMSKFANDVYATESVAFFTAGLLKSYPGNDLYIESCLSKISSLESLSQSIDLCMKIMGTAAASGNRQLGRTYNNARLLQCSQIPCLESKNSIMNESIDYVLTNFHKRESIWDYIQQKCLRFQIKAVLDNKIVTNSFQYNLHPRLGEITRHMQRDLHSLIKFMIKVSEDKRLLNEDVIQMKLSIILQNLYTIISVLSRASRSISIGLYNNDHEINTAELHYTEKILEMLLEVEELNKISQDIDVINACAKSIKDMGGYFVTEGFVEK